MQLKNEILMIKLGLDTSREGVAELISILEEILNPKEKKLLVEIFNTSWGLSNCIVTNDYDQIMIDSFRSLFGNHKIDDSVINWYSGHLQEQFLKNSKLVLITTYWLTSTYYLVKENRSNRSMIRNIQGSEIILGPCWWTGHWGFIGYDRTKREGFWGDSMGTAVLSEDQKNTFGEVLKRWNVIKEHDTIKFSRCKIPLQEDGWSCGLGVLRTMQKFSKKKELKWSNDATSILAFKAKLIRQIVIEFGLEKLTR
jgi:Ulp1 family protease